MLLLNKISKNRNIFFWAIFIIIYLWFVFTSLFGIGSYWAWGHNGCNGAAFYNAARNSVNFGILGQAIYHTSTTAPVNLYTHHPLLVHFHLIIIYYLFGNPEWAGRLVPAFYSMMVPLMLFYLVWKNSDKYKALLSIFVYALIPLNIIFANMIDHEQGSIFWMLFLVYNYIEWFKNGTRKNFVCTLIGATLALQFDWAGYYLSFFLAVHAFVYSIYENYKQGKILIWNKKFVWVIVFSVIVLVNALAFFAWIYYQVGNFNDMIGIYRHRSGFSGNYLDHYLRIFDLHGKLLVILYLLWIPYFFIKLFLKKISWIDFIALLFLGCQIIHSVVFKNAGYVHSYWIYYAGIFIAVGIASMLYDIFCVISKKVANVTLRNFIMIFFSFLLLIVFSVQLFFVWDRLIWAFKFGHAAYVQPMYDTFNEVSWARDLGEKFKRGETYYFVHNSVKKFRIEFSYYIYSPFEKIKDINVLNLKTKLKKEKNNLLILDYRNLSSVEKININKLSLNHKIYLWDNRFIAVDLKSDKQEFVAYKSEKEHASVFRKWLVNPIHPEKVIWHLYEELNPVFKNVSLSDDNEYFTPAGGSGGGDYKIIFDKKDTITSVEAGTLNTAIQYIKIFKQNPDNKVVPEIIGKSVKGDSVKLLKCDQDDKIVGIQGFATSFLTNFSLICQNKDTLKYYNSDSVGKRLGTNFKQQCSDKYFLNGFWGMDGALVDSIGIICSKD